MADKKKQHYVPKFYMRRFLYDKNNFYLFNLDIKKSYGLVPYKNQCYEDYFYGKDKVWEDRLSEKERIWDCSFSSFIEGNYNKDVIKSLKEFAVFQKGRTVDQVEKQIYINAEMYYQQMRIVIEHDDTINGNKQKYYDAAHKKALEMAQQKMTPSALLDIFEKIVDIIDDMQFSHLKIQTKEKIISNDNPIIMINNLNNNLGFGTVGLIIMFPLSKTDLIIFYDEKIYPKLSANKTVIIKNEYVTKQINKMIFCNANNLIYSSCDLAKYLYSNSLFECWKNNRSIKCVSSISSRNDALVAVHYPSLQYIDDLYLFKIDSKFDFIKKDYRTPVPRKFEIGFAEKLKREMDDIPKVLSRSKNEVINEAYINDYALGHKKYYHLMMEYWNKSNH